MTQTHRFPDGVRAIPPGRAATPSGLSRSASSCSHRIAIAGPSRSFIELTRNIELAENAPRRFEPTKKGESDVVI
jgi:hypothetical protein